MDQYKIGPELRDKLVSWFTDIADRAERLTSGNVSHNKAYIVGKARRAAEYLKKNCVELKEEWYEQKGRIRREHL